MMKLPLVKQVMETFEARLIDVRDEAPPAAAAAPDSPEAPDKEETDV
jgi:hypothetical protein